MAVVDVGSMVVGNLAGRAVTRNSALSTAAELNVANRAGDLSQATIRSRVTANLAESAAARNSSKFEQLGRYETAYSFY